MSLSANVLSVQALEDLRSGLARFSSEAQEIMSSAAQEIQRTLQWLEERHRYWQGEVRRRAEMLARAQADLARCQRPVQDSEGRVYIPPCPREKEMVRQAQAFLAQAQNELRTVEQAARAVQQAASDYQRQAQRLNTYVSSDLPKANALLGRKIATLQSYIAMSAPSADVGYSSSDYSAGHSDTVDGPTQVAAAFAAAIGVTVPLTDGAAEVASHAVDDFYVQEPERDTTPPTSEEELLRRVRELEEQQIPLEQEKIEQIKSSLPPASAGTQYQPTPQNATMPDSTIHGGHGGAHSEKSSEVNREWGREAIERG